MTDAHLVRGSVRVRVRVRLRLRARVRARSRARVCARGVEVVEGGEVVGGEAVAWRRRVGIRQEEGAHHALPAVGRSAQHDACLGMREVRGGQGRLVEARGVAL